MPAWIQAVAGYPNFVLADFFSESGLSQNEITFQELGISCLLEFKQLRDALIFFWPIFFLSWNSVKMRKIFRNCASRACLNSSSCGMPNFFFGQFFFWVWTLLKWDNYSGIVHLVPAWIQAVAGCPIFFWPVFFWVWTLPKRHFFRNH